MIGNVPKEFEEDLMLLESSIEERRIRLEAKEEQRRYDALTFGNYVAGGLCFGLLYLACLALLAVCF